MHKNTYINAPKVLNKYFQMKNYKNIFFAGQLSGVEGYVESIFGGLLCGINMYRHLEGLDLVELPKETMGGALQNYIASASDKNFQPMSANMGLINDLDIRIKDKKEKYTILANRALDKLNEYKIDIKEV